ncbi:pyridoxamine 5'-phosphate oxidase family protein [Ramlibacter sp.]|uniref:pyridoxamine 5'-phosphate oxidase family protein n=1 Tax=Ramlibacter sp. TaxID=1917967 RepID=UPI002BC7B15B|nr:pyridoxamine 5'-phosphate oxidase family protein [Ramlibacter sp.]HWI84153.1 pyridoxamine 5'-phosphate oxidase family protein [Ramlibacter sp.]
MKPRTDHELLWRMIKDIRFAMLTHRHADGTLHAHPMTMQNKSLDETDEVLYFFVGRASEVGRRLATDGSVNLAYVDPAKDVYVSIAGQATVNEDPAIKKKLFNALDKAWFPDGADDRNLELVEVRIRHAEYWNAKESRLSQLLKVATAAATHQQAHVGEHRELQVGQHG